jgi:hypothetical protein
VYVQVTFRKDQGQYWFDPVKAFAEAYPKFHVGERLSEEGATPFDKLKSHSVPLVSGRYALSHWKFCFL